MESGQTPKGGPGGSGNEQQDMFLVPAVRQSIPPIDEVPETQEEKRERKLVRLAIGVVIALVLVALATAAYFSFRAIQRSNAIAEAEQLGGPAELEAALEHLEGGGAATRATRARLQAELVYLGVATDSAAVQELLNADAKDEDGKAERIIAAVYLALTAGDAGKASQLASRLVPTGDLAAEAARVRSLAASAVDNLQVAVEQAKIARDRFPDSPRHVALYGSMLSRSGDPAGALTALEPATGGDMIAPPVRLARALAHTTARSALAEAVGDAETVAGDSSSAPRRQAWASLISGRLKRYLGDAQGSRAALARAAELSPQGDERFQLELAAGYLALGERLTALEVLRRPAPGLAAPAFRKRLVAEAHVLAGQWPEASRVLAELNPEPQVRLLRGRLLLGQQKLDEAGTSLAGLQADAGIGFDLTLLKAQIAMAAKDWTAAHGLLAELHEAHPEHPEVTAALADTLRNQGKGAESEELLASALQGDGENAFLLASRARQEAAKEAFDEAFASMQAAVAGDVADPGRLTELAQMARRVSKTEEARSAFQGALELQARFPAALAGLLELEVDDEHPAEAMALVERVDAANLGTLEVEILRARAFVLASRGAAGVREVRKGIRNYGNHGRLYRELGHLYFQGEEYDNASSSYARALRAVPEGERDMELELLQALSYARARRAAPAERILEDLPRELPPELAVIRAVVQGRIYLIDKQKARVRDRGRAALRISENFPEGLLLMADDARSRDQYEQELEYLRRAAQQTPVPPESLGRLAQRSEISIDERCAYRKRYLSAAPRGPSAQTLRQRLRSCP